METKTPPHLARESFVKGANCAEAMWQAFSTGLAQDEQELGNCLAGGFGGGMGMGDLCGAVAGGVMVIGLYYGRPPGKPRSEKLKQLCQEFYQRAEDELGSVHCRDLRDPDDEDYREKCTLLVEKMAVLIEELLADPARGEGSRCPG